MTIIGVVLVVQDGLFIIVCISDIAFISEIMECSWYSTVVYLVWKPMTNIINHYYKMHTTFKHPLSDGSPLPEQDRFMQ